jgi:hypothetical protein
MLGLNVPRLFCLVLSASALALANAGCASAAPGGGSSDPPQMNDISVLFPLAKIQSDFQSHLAASAQGRGGALLPQDLYESSAEPHSQPMPYDTLRVVAFRLDPCFANVGPITPQSSCQAQIRLVFQPLTYTSGSTIAFDGAVHAFYSLTADELVSAVRDVIGAREANGGSEDLGPLAVHPIMAAQGPGGPMARALDAIVTRYAGAANLVRFTLLRSASLVGNPGSGEDRFWNFSGYDVAGGALTPMVIPALPAGSTNVNFLSTTEPLEGTFSPDTSAADDMQAMASATRFDTASKDEQSRDFDAALRIENPDFHSPNTIDCASCHLAQPSRDLVAAKLGYSAKDNPSAFAANPQFVPAADMALTTSQGGAELNVHAFSYRDDKPMINARVVNESAAIVAYLRGTSGKF